MNENMRQNDDMEIDLLELAGVLWRKAWAIILCFIIGALIAGSCTKFLITPQYSASSMIYVLTKTTSVTSIADLQVGTQLTTDFLTLAKSRPVVEKVIEKLNLDTTYEEFVDTITIENPSDTRILKITANNPDPELARDISNETSEATVERIAEVMDTDKPNIVEKAIVPKAPSSPNLLKNTAMGALLGAILMSAIIIIRYLLDDTITTEEDVKKYLGTNVLSAIPDVKKSRKKKVA